MWCGSFAVAPASRKDNQQSLVYGKEFGLFIVWIKRNDQRTDLTIWTANNGVRKPQTIFKFDILLAHVCIKTTLY